MSEHDETDWEYLMSKDNRTVEELSQEDISLLEEYEKNQIEIYNSGLPYYLVDIYSSDRVIHPRLKNCATCDQSFDTQTADEGYENIYCSLDCMLRDQI